MKDVIKFFTQCRAVREILGNNINLSSEQKNNIVHFFSEFPDGDRSMIWRKNLASWINQGLDNWIQRRYQLKQCTSNSIEWHRLMYGDQWETYYQNHQAQIRSRLPSRTEYWIKLGLTPAEAVKKVKESQRKKGNAAAKKLSGTSMYTVRSMEYWKRKGYSVEEAQRTVAALQKRDLDFYINRFGLEEGTARFTAANSKKKNTWRTKNKNEHARKTLPKSFNPNGQEMKAITNFLRVNEIDPRFCKYGSPKDQFFQYIPDVGYRRYDLAVFDNEHHSKLKCILEFHGPGHINFSDYRLELENEPITINGKKLAHLGTYGAAYHNDKAKRDHILTTFPDVIYLVMWYEDFYNGRYRIDELSS